VVSRLWFHVFVEGCAHRSAAPAWGRGEAAAAAAAPAAAAGLTSGAEVRMESSARLLVAGAATAVAAAVGAAVFLGPSAPGEEAEAKRRDEDDEEPTGEQHSAHASLSAELRGMRLRALQARALEAGIDEDSVDEALDADSPKEQLVQLLLVHAPARRLEAALPAALERAIGDLEQRSIASPRKARRVVRDVVGRAEAALDAVGADGEAEHMARCGASKHERLAEAMAAVEDISGVTDVVEAAGLLDVLLQVLEGGRVDDAATVVVVVDGGSCAMCSPRRSTLAYPRTRS
jgi:hypothetical protein